MKIVARVHELSKKHNCKMSQIAIAWQWEKGIVSPIIGATNITAQIEPFNRINYRKSSTFLKD